MEKFFKVTHETSEGKIIVEHETSLKWVNIIVASVMRDGGKVLGIEKTAHKGF